MMPRMSETSLCDKKIIHYYIWKMQKEKEPYNIGGLSPKLLSCVLVSLMVISSAIGYVLGMANFDDSPNCNVEVEVKTDSALMEVIRGQVKVEMEMLKVINENMVQKTPIVNNIIKPRPSNCKPGIVNSFNHNNIRTDSLSR